MKIKVTPRSVNSKPLFDEIHGTCFEAMTSMPSQWTRSSYRQSFVEMIEMFLGEFQENGRIDQFNVICDKRNNKCLSSNTRTFNFEIQYKQRHCLNVTRIEYVIQL